jgi:hypothetical protein
MVRGVAARRPGFMENIERPINDIHHPLNKC